MINVFTFFLASLSSYFLIKILTKNILIATLSSLIFATGYIGIDQFTQMNIPLMNNISIIIMCFAMVFFILWLDKKNIRFYFISILLYLLGLTLFPFRIFSLILFIPTLGIIFSLRFSSSIVIFLKELTISLLQFIPFLVVPYFLGIYSYGDKPTSQGIQNYSIKNNALDNILSFEFIEELFAILGRFVLVKPITYIFNFSPDRDFFVLTGLIFFLTVLLTSLFFFFGKYSRYGRSLLIALLFTIEGYIGNMILLVEFDSNGPVNRYLTTSFLFFSATISLFLFLLLEMFGRFEGLNKKRILIVVVSFIILSFALMSREYENDIIENRSIPAKNFFKQLKTYVPTLSDNRCSVFYFDNASYSLIPARFGNVLASGVMAGDVNIAMPYEVSINSVKILRSYEDFLYFIKNPPCKKVSYYSFYYDEKGLHATTEKVFTLLENGSQAIIPAEQVSYKKNHGLSSITIAVSDVSTLTSLTIRFNLKVILREPSLFSFPYIGVSTVSKVEEKDIKNFFQRRNVNKSNIFSYLIARKKFYQTIKVEVDSEHVDKKHPGSLLIDQREDTFWLTDENKPQERWIKLDLSETRKISRMLWRQEANRIPTKYEILTSLDGLSWTKIRNVDPTRVGSEENLIVNNFDPVDARFVKIVIEETKNSFSPGFSEIEVIDATYQDVDLEAALRIFENPFEYIENLEELEKTNEYLRENATLKISTLTNKDGVFPNNDYNKFSIILDGTFHDYKFTIPATGIYLKSIGLEFNFPAEIVISDILIENDALR